MDLYMEIKQRVLQTASKTIDLSELHLLLQKEYDELLDFIASRDALLVPLACDGIGTDDAFLVQVLCNRTRSQLQAADVHFRKTSQGNVTMKERVRSETSGNYGAFMTSILQADDDVNAKNLKRAFDGMGCDKSAVNEIFTTLSNEDLKAMRRAYEGLHDSNLMDRLRSELSGEHEYLIIAIMERGRGEGPANPATAEAIARQLRDVIKDGSKMMGGLSDKAERSLIDILVAQSPAQLIEINAAHERAFSKSLTGVIKDKTGGDLEEGLLGLFKDPLDALCAKIKKATEGMGCDEETITRIIGGNDKSRVRQIANRYKEKYDVDFRQVIKSETGGNYENALLTWIDGQDPTKGYVPGSSGSVEAEVDRLIKCIWDIRSQIANLDYNLLKRAAKGIGTNERLVVSILCRRTKSHLDMVDEVFRAKEGGKSLRDYIVNEMGGNLEDFLEYTQMEEDEFDAIMLFEAFKGLGCDTNAVIEVMTTRPYKRLHAARQFYEGRNDHSLMDALVSELRGNVEYLCCRLLAGARGIAERNGSNLGCSPEEYVDKLYDAGAGKWGTDEKTFIDFLTGSSLREIKLVGAAYESKYHSSLEAVIKSEFSGKLQKALINLCNDPLDVYARYIKEYCEGFGTNESGLNRILGGNDKETVLKISERYFQKYDITLEKTLKSELSGDYLKACLAWIEPPSFGDGYLLEVVERLQRDGPPSPPEPDVVPATLLPFPEPTPPAADEPEPEPEPAPRAPKPVVEEEDTHSLAASMAASMLAGDDFGGSSAPRSAPRQHKRREGRANSNHMKISEKHLRQGLRFAMKLL